jgi:hypothetical protein
MAKYLILIYGDATQWAAMSAEEEKAHSAAHEAFREAAGEKRILGGEELVPAAEAATAVRAGSAGRVTVTDGPFLETKEAVGGYYLLEASDLDEVLALTELLPEVHASHSGVEIRPVVDHG